MKIYYRYNNTIRDILSKNELANTFYGIVIPATLAKYYKNSISTFFEHFTKPYFIDPMTYFLNQSIKNICNEKNLPRKSYRMLVEEYLDVNIEYDLNNIHEIEDDFLTLYLDKIGLDRFCSNVLQFQKECFKKTEIDEFAEEYLNEKIKEKNYLDFLIAPYFLIEDEDSYNLNRDCIQMSLKLIKPDDPPLYGCFTISKSFLNDNPRIIRRILEDFKELNNFIIWISDFDAYKENFTNLQSLKEIIKNLSDNNKKNIINLYGDYFSLILSKFGLTGFCSSISGGNKKRARLYKGSGGGPSTKVYIPQLHREIIEENFRAQLQANRKLICDCTKCKEIISGLKKQHPNFINYYINELMSNKNYLIHFIYCRATEKEFIQNNDLNSIIGELKEKKEAFQENIYSDHLDNWINDI